MYSVCNMYIYIYYVIHIYIYVCMMMDMMIYDDSGDVLNPNGLSLVFSVFMFVVSLVAKDRCQLY